MLIFVVVVGITYSYVEVSLFLPDNKLAEQGVSSIGTRYGVRVPFFVSRFLALLSPFLIFWGYYGLTREYPLVQFLAKDQAFFCRIWSASRLHLAYPSLPSGVLGSHQPWQRTGDSVTRSEGSKILRGSGLLVTHDL